MEQFKPTELIFHIMVEASPSALVLINSQGEIVYVNSFAEELFQYSKKELLGENIELLIPDRFKKNHPNSRNSFMNSQETRPMGIGRDLFALRNDGTEFPAEIGLNPIESEGKGLILASIIDITERKKHEKEILQSKHDLQILSEKLQVNNIELEKKNHDINESIAYASRIQYSILPELPEIEKHLTDLVLFFEPRNVIGGDFYWFYHQNNISFIAVVDCTGHSVPGALMSMIVNSLLNEIMQENKCYTAGEILSELHKKLYNYLQQSKGDKYSQDGCDISLCIIDKTKKELQYAGAGQDVYLHNKQSITILKASPKAIGGLSILGKEEPERIFSTEYIEIAESMFVAMTTDGILDQLNENNEIFGINKFVKMLIEYQSSNQKSKMNYITETINNWKNNVNQQDDQLMLAFKVE